MGWRDVCGCNPWEDLKTREDRCAGSLFCCFYRAAAALAAASLLQWRCSLPPAPAHPPIWPPTLNSDAREAEQKAAAEAAAAEAKRKVRQQGKNFALMSFGERL